MILVYFSHHMILLLDYQVQSEAYRIFDLLKVRYFNPQIKQPENVFTKL
jgi:hypothetical protein